MGVSCRSAREVFFHERRPCVLLCTVCGGAPACGNGPGSSGRRDNLSLSRQICAFGNWTLPLPKLYNPVSSDQVELINRKTVRNAWNFVYAPTNDPHLAALMKRIAESAAEPK